MKSLIDSGLQYILNGDGTEELYDLDTGVLEEENLIGTTNGRAAASKLRALLQQHTRR